MKKLFQNIPSEFYFLFKIYLFGIAVFTFFRILLLVLSINSIHTASVSLLLQSFLMGWRFDTVICCYILAFPTFLLLTNVFRKNKIRLLSQLAKVFLLVCFGLSFLISIVDIPFFLHYLSRVTFSIFNWSGNWLFGFKLIFQSAENYIFLLLFFILCYLSFKIINRIEIKTFKNNTQLNSPLKNRISIKIVYSILFCGSIFLGIRGRIALKSPIQWGTAFISENNFVNQLGLNPNFTFLKSYFMSINPENKRLHFLSDELAIKNIQNDLGIKATKIYSSPIARKISVTGQPVRANVIIVIMESMGLTKTGLDNNPINMTPYLDSLAKLSTTFNNIFSAGIHTYNGVYSTLFGMPALMNKHTMFASDNTIQPFSGIAKTLNKFNYQSVFICPHDEEFDNMGGFLKANGFQKIVGQKDFPNSEINSTMGIPDDLLFEHAVAEINNLHKNSKPFLASILTGSDHEPIYIPENCGFVPKTKTKKQQAVEYADWSINKFLKLCSKEKWYDSTIFVFIADHGSWYRDYYVMSLSYNKIPLIFFAPKILPTPKLISNVGGQIDMFPTIMGILNYPYINNTMGVDLLKEGRKYIAFSADDKLGCANEEYFWYHNYSMDNEFLHHYKNKEEKQYIVQFGKLKDTLKNYAESLLQATQWLIENKKLNIQN